MAEANVVSKLKWWVKPLIIGRTVIGFLVLLFMVFLVFRRMNIQSKTIDDKQSFSKTIDNKQETDDIIVIVALFIIVPIISLASLFIFRINRLFASIEIYATYMVVKSLWKTHTIKFDEITGFKEEFNKKALHLYKEDKRIYEIPIRNYGNYEDLKCVISKHIENLGGNNISSTNEGFNFFLMILFANMAFCGNYFYYQVIVVGTVIENTTIEDLVAVKAVISKPNITRYDSYSICLYLKGYENFEFRTEYLNSEHNQELDNVNWNTLDIGDSVTVYLRKDEYMHKLKKETMHSFYKTYKYIGLFGIEKNNFVYIDKQIYLEKLTRTSLGMNIFLFILFFLLCVLMPITLWFVSWLIFRDAIKFYWRGGEILE